MVYKWFFSEEWKRYNIISVYVKSICNIVFFTIILSLFMVLFQKDEKNSRIYRYEFKKDNSNNS